LDDARHGSRHQKAAARRAVERVRAQEEVDPTVAVHVARRGNELAPPLAPRASISSSFVVVTRVVTPALVVPMMDHVKVVSLSSTSESHSLSVRTTLYVRGPAP